MQGERRRVRPRWHDCALRTQIAGFLDNINDGGPEPGGQLAQLFCAASGRFGTHFVVIDGWDTCARHQQRALLDMLGSIQANDDDDECRSRLKVFIASCDGIGNNNVPPAFKRSFYSLAVSRKHVNADIAAFVQETLQEKDQPGRASGWDF